MATYLVTGGAGFIGTNLCEELRKTGARVIALDDLRVSDKNKPFLQSIGVEVVEKDIANFEDIVPHFAGVDVVFHLAAMNRAQRSIENPSEANKTNVTGTINVLEACRRQPRMPKLVFASSSSVYSLRSGLLSEDDALKPSHPYGVGKLAGEQYVRVYGELYGLRYVTLRLFSVYGPRQLGDITHAGVIAKFIYQARSGKPLTVNGDGSQRRNFTYVADVVRSILLASTALKAEQTILNIANPTEITVKEVAQTIEKVTHARGGITWGHVQVADVTRNAANVERARLLLGYEPHVSFSEGIALTVAWYDSQKET
jgi:nucleoside-diphosphate-sugar epimerase